MKMARILADLAFSRANLHVGFSTARACGDSKWVRENQESYEQLDRRVEALKKVLRPEVIAEAREITSALI